jgi:circadian clock protein KaiB
VKTGPRFKFRLYVAGEGPNSSQAFEHLQVFCREFLAERHEIEIVDVMLDPQRALFDGVFLTPLLLRVAPCPLLRIVGNLSEPKPLLRLLELPPDP